MTSRPRDGGPGIRQSLLRVTLLMVSLMAMLISPISAEEIRIDITDERVESLSHTVGAASSPVLTSYYVGDIGVADISTFTDPHSLIWFPGGSIHLRNPQVYAETISAEYTYKDTNIGSGYLSYYLDVDGTNSYIVIVFDSWNASVIGSDTGSGSIGISYNYTEWNVEKFSYLKVNYRIGPVWLQFPGNYTMNFKLSLHNVITLTNQTPETYNLTVQKQFETSYITRTLIKSVIKTTPYIDVLSNQNIYLSVPIDDAPYEVATYYPPMDRWYNRTINTSTVNGDPAGPTTIYVRDSQTGALLAGAHLVITDAATSPTTEVVNQTLSAGTGTFSLPKADSLRYHASATADGYALLSPILFGVPEDGTTIILWMSPDAPPDVPTEPEKSMLYGYIQTQGSQQPIPGAIVSLDGYGSTTTSSTGFYLFNNVTPGTYDISASAPLHTTLSEPVTVDATATQHNLALKGHFLLTVTIMDGDDLTTLHNTTISLSDGQESTQNPATFTADYGPYTITAAAGGYYPQIQSAYLDKPGTTTATVLLTAKPEPVPPPEMPNYPPHNVKFTIQTLLGTPISGVSVTAQGIQQTPSTNILERLLGLNMTATPINSELMNGTTDSNGEINFMMVEAVKYQISIYKPDVVNQTLEIYPKEDTYPIIISTAGGPLLPDAGDALRDIHINVTTSTEGDTGHIHIDYNDTTRKTTSLTIQVTQQNTTDSSAPEEIIASHTVANDANVTHTFDLSVYKGHSYFVRLEAEHPDYGTVHRDYAVAFKGVRVPLGPLPDGLYIYVAGFGLMLLGGIFGATSATRGVVVIALAGWLFWGFGWLDDLGLIAPVSLGLVSTLAVMGVIVTRYREEGYQ